MDLSSDYLCWDQVEAISLEIPTRAAPRTLDVSVAKRRAIRSREKSPSGGVYQGFETRWLIPARMLPTGEKIEPAQVILDQEGTRWTVLTVDRNKHGHTWAAGCVNLALALQLRDTVTIERATISADAAGAAIKTFDRILYTVQARVQQITEQIALERGVRYAKGRYDVIVDRQLFGLDIAEDRVKWFEGDLVRYLDITGYRAPERIDELPVIEAERR